MGENHIHRMLLGSSLMTEIIRKKLDDRILEIIDLPKGHTDRNILNYLNIAEENNLETERYLLKEIVFDIGKNQIFAVSTKNGRSHNEANLENYLMQNGLKDINDGLKLIKNQHAIDSGVVDILAREGRNNIGIELKAEKYNPRHVFAQLKAYINDPELDRVIFIAPEINRGLFNSLRQDYANGKIDFYEVQKRDSQYLFSRITEKNLSAAKHKNLDFKSKKNTGANSQIIKVVQKPKQKNQDIPSSDSEKNAPSNEYDLMDIMRELSEKRVYIDQRSIDELNTLRFVDGKGNVLIKSIRKLYRDIFDSEMPPLPEIDKMDMDNLETPFMNKFRDAALSRLSLSEYSERFIALSMDFLRTRIAYGSGYSKSQPLDERLINFQRIDKLMTQSDARMINEAKSLIRMYTKDIDGVITKPETFHMMLSGFYHYLFLVYSDMSRKTANILSRADPLLGYVFSDIHIMPVRHLASYSEESRRVLDGPVMPKILTTEKFEDFSSKDLQEYKMLALALISTSNVVGSINVMSGYRNHCMGTLRLKPENNGRLTYSVFNGQNTAIDDKSLYDAITGNKNGSIFTEDNIARIKYFLDDLDRFGATDEHKQEFSHEFKKLRLSKIVHDDTPSDIHLRNFFDDITINYVQTGKVPDISKLEKMYAASRN